jgi:hypothetical protein
MMAKKMPSRETVRAALQARERDIGFVSGPDDFAAAFAASREAVERLVLYERLLRQWQKAVNLVAPSTLDAVWHATLPTAPSSCPWLPPPRAPGSTWLRRRLPGLVVAILLASPRPLSPHNANLSRGSISAGRGSG